jgi:SSS family solute:Na+ symporter
MLGAHSVGSGMHFTTLDYIVVAVYLVGIALFGILRGGRQRSASDYFLGREQIPWWVVCFAIVAAETSTLTFISIPALAYLGNLTFLQVTLGYLIGRILVSTILLPSYFRGELSTAYAFLEVRFGAKTRRFASVVFLFTRIAADGVRLFATAIPLKFMLDIDYPLAIAIIALVALSYTALGGVRGVIWVDAIQMVVYVGGALIAAAVLIAEYPGGWEGIIRPALEAGKFTAVDLGFGPGFWSRPYTLLAGLVGGALLSMASHGTDQLIVQRLLTTRSVRAGRKALIGSGILVNLQFALFLGVGLLLYGHYGGQSITELGLVRADEIFPRFIVEGLPPGISGFIIAGLLAAALSTLAGSMSAMSSSTVLDLYRPLRTREVSPERELWLSRAVTVLWALLLAGSAVFFMNTPQTVVELALSIASFTYGGLLGTFLLGVLFRRPRQEDALAAFVAGILIMIVVISLSLVAWTWYTLIGVVTTLAVGSLLSALSGKAQKPVA